MNLQDYKKDIAELDKRISEITLKPVSNWDIDKHSEIKPFYQTMLGDDGMTAEERKDDAIKSLQHQRKTLLANAGELALYGETDNLGIG